jgi:catechol 2,3-dioxygenase-like lactoylglutathione lyase family enzyme
MELETLDHVGLNVADVDRSIRWYREVLGLHRVHQESWGDFPAVMKAGGSGVALFPGDHVALDPPARSPEDMSHVGFRTSRGGLERARTEVRELGIEFHEGDYGVAWSIYFDDPDGHQIENHDLRATGVEPALRDPRSGRRESNPHSQLGRLELCH